VERNAMNDSTPRTLHDIAVGIRATRTRGETDPMGAIEVPADRYWGRRRSAASSTSGSATCRRNIPRRL
jgi:hypothetical protein